MTDQVICKNCKFAGPADGFSRRLAAIEQGESAVGLYHCTRWKSGYGVTVDELANNEPLIENDEGWGNVVGPEFGCVLGELK